MIEFISARCPQCGEELEIEKGRDFAYCTYCGTKIIINNTNEHVFRNVDEAEIRRAEIDREIRLRELELEEKRDKHRRVFIWLWVIVCLLLAVPGVFGLVIENEALSILFLWDMIMFFCGILFFLQKQEEDKKKQTLLHSDNPKPPQTISGEFQKLGDAVIDNFKQAFDMLFKK